MIDRAPRSAPYFSIVTATRNDAWSLVKTARSLFEQTFRDFEYIVIDGASSDASMSLVSFWQDYGLVTDSISEPDDGVYSAMNKGLQKACGRFICWMNAGDVFASKDTLQLVHDLLEARQLDGLLGWGQLKNQIWASWTESEAFKMASLGFCHQSLYVRHELLEQEPFDERPFKTDSDTLQLGRLYARGARIAILPEVLAIRGGEPGISADLERSGNSIRSTLLEEYSILEPAHVERILAFRRKCESPEEILELFDLPDSRCVRHLACMVLDTLLLPQSRALSLETCDILLERSLAILVSDKDTADVDRFVHAQRLRAQSLELLRSAKQRLNKTIISFGVEEERRIASTRGTLVLESDLQDADVVVSLTSFPPRLATVGFAIRSLLEQTHRPREIHLWLGRDEVPGRNWLPRLLLDLEERGLQIHFAKRTFHQYDKYLHNSELNKDRAFIIVDDDVIYPSSSVEHLLRAHQQHPNSIIGNRCHLIGISDDDTILPYMTWKREARLPDPSFRLIPTGAGGVLYPPGFLSDSTATNVEDILAHAPYADDLWLKFCALARDVPTFATALSHKADWYHRYTPTMQAGTLMTTNVDRGLNDAQVARCVEWLTRLRPDWQAGALVQEDGV